MLNDEILQLKSYDDKTGREISNVFPITNLEAVKVENDKNLKEKLTDISNNIEQIDKKIDSHIENHSQSNEHVSIDDTTISIAKTWSSSKIDDVVLTNVGAIWKEINGGQVMIDSTMDGFLRDVEILGNTVQNYDDFSNIQHLGVWNEEKQGYEIEIVVSNSSSKDDLNYQEYRTAIILPCQLMKVGNVADRLYWDKNKGRYIINKKIEIYKPNDLTINKLTNYGGVTNGYQALITRLDDSTISKIGGNWQATTNSYSNLFEARNQGGLVNYNNNECIALSPTDLYIKYKKEKYQDLNTFKNFLIENDLYILFITKTPGLIETDIREEITLPTFMNNTYVTVAGGIQGSIQAKAPVDGGKLIKALQEENTELKETNTIQDKLINTTLLVTDELLSILEPLLVDLLNTCSSSKIVDMYVNMVQRGIKNEDEIHTRYREQVKALLDK